MWIVLVLVADCAIFAGLALLGASLSLILCVGFAALIGSIWLVYSTGSWWLADQLNLVLGRLDKIQDAVCGPFDHEMLLRSGGVVGLCRKLGHLREEIERLTQMAEFVGEQSHPNFANAVESFKGAQEEERRRQAQRESEERAFKETLDAAARDASAERKKEADAARDAFRRSQQTEQSK